MNFAPSKVMSDSASDVASAPAQDAASDVALTRDTLFDGRLRLTQPAKGHRAGTDAVLLAASAPASAGLIIDVGAGVGTVGLALAFKNPAARVILLERDPVLAALARRNAQANAVHERVDIAETSILAALPRRNAGVKNESADIVLTNPPFYEAGSVRRPEERLKRDAHVLDGSLSEWITACVALLRPGGTLCVVHRAEALADVLAPMRQRLGAIVLQPIHSHDGEPASRVVLTGTKGSKGPLRLMPGRVLHEAGGGFTSWATAIHASPKADF